MSASSRVVVISALFFCSLAAMGGQSDVELMRSSGAILDKDTNKVKFDDLTIVKQGDTVRVRFKWTIWAKNNTEIDQLLVSVNGKVVSFVFNGIAGNAGKAGTATLAFSKSDFNAVGGKYNIELGFCEDYGMAQAKRSYEGPNKGGYRILVGYIR